MALMNPGFLNVLSASRADRRDLFVGAGNRLGTAEQNVEKDFWVCWTLDTLFNSPVAAGPRLLFKGGTSLSKGYGLIERFSEDIDITVFRDDIGEPAIVEELEALSGKKRTARLESIFNRPAFDLSEAVQGSFTLAPHEGMVDNLHRDYEAMSGMIFGKIPPIDNVLATIAELEERINAEPKQKS